MVFLKVNHKKAHLICFLLVIVEIYVNLMSILNLYSAYRRASNALCDVL